MRNFQSHTIYSDAASTSPFSSSNSLNPSSRRSKGECLYFGARGNGGTCAEHLEEFQFRAPILSQISNFHLHAVA